MKIVSHVFIALVALEHLYILYLEMFAWTKPRTLKIFGTKPQFASESKSLAANQGLYNGFLAAGLIWSLFYHDPLVGREIALFFLSCVLVAAIYGGLSVKRSILILQGFPSFIALLLTLEV